MLCRIHVGFVGWGTAHLYDSVDLGDVVLLESRVAATTKVREANSLLFNHNRAVRTGLNGQVRAHLRLCKSSQY